MPADSEDSKAQAKRPAIEISHQWNKFYLVLSCRLHDLFYASGFFSVFLPGQRRYYPILALSLCSCYSGSIYLVLVFIKKAWYRL